MSFDTFDVNEECPTNQEVFEYLDCLRDSGETNMLGARPYILREFPVLLRKEAEDLLLEWMRTFSERHLIS